MSNCCSLLEMRDKAPAVMACPASGTGAKQVDSLTVESLVRHLPFALPHSQYYFCDAPACDVVYFSNDPKAPVFGRQNLLVPVGAKESDDSVPVCYCFGIARRQIREEIQSAGRSTVPQRIKAEVQAGRCACKVKNPSGKCCLGEIIRAVRDATMERESFAALQQIFLADSACSNSLR